MTSTEKENRTLTDDDVKAIVAEAQKVMVAQFYSDLGKGVWIWLKRGIVLGLIAIAAVGYFKGK